VSEFNFSSVENINKRKELVKYLKTNLKPIKDKNFFVFGNVNREKGYTTEVYTTIDYENKEHYFDIITPESSYCIMFLVESLLYEILEERTIIEEKIIYKTIENKEIKEEKEKYIYFIQAKELGYVKIGVSDNPERRLKELQKGRLDELILLTYIEGNIELEKKFHKRFAKYNLKSIKNNFNEDEWFLGDKEILTAIDKIIFLKKQLKDYIDEISKF